MLQISARIAAGNHQVLYPGRYNGAGHEENCPLGLYDHGTPVLQSFKGVNVIFENDDLISTGEIIGTQGLRQIRIAGATGKISTSLPFFLSAGREVPS